MTRIAKSAAAVAGALALTLAPTGQPASAASSISPPTVPAELAVPEGHHVVSRYAADGVQVYECTAAGAWTLHAPVARLSNQDTQDVGKHFGGVDAGLPAGPYWQSYRDRSRVHGGEALRAPAPDPNAIPWLRLTALDRSGSGVFSAITYIHRVDTTGGLAPAGSCDPGAIRAVPYTANYYFYEGD
jgi:hypothetical protein